MIRGDQRIGQVISENIVQNLPAVQNIQTAGTDEIRNDIVENPPYRDGDQQLHRPFDVLFQIKGMVKQKCSVCHQE